MNSILGDIGSFSKRSEKNLYYVYPIKCTKKNM